MLALRLWERWWTVLLFHCRYILMCYNLFVLAQSYLNGMLRYCVWHQQFYFHAEVNDSYCICSSHEVRDRRYCRYDIIGSCVEAMWFSSRSWFWIAVYNVRYNVTSWCFFRWHYIVRSELMCTDCWQQAYMCVWWSAYGMFYIICIFVVSHDDVLRM